MKKIFAITALFVTAFASSAIAADEYDLAVTSPSSAKAGQKAEASVVVTAKSGWKVNQDYPAKLILEETAGVKLEKTKLSKGDAAKFDKHTAEFKVALTAEAAGKKEIKGTLKFAVCDEAATSCVTKKESVVISVDAK